MRTRQIQEPIIGHTPRLRNFRTEDRGSSRDPTTEWQVGSNPNPCEITRNSPCAGFITGQLDLQSSHVSSNRPSGCPSEVDIKVSTNDRSCGRQCNPIRDLGADLAAVDALAACNPCSRL